MTSLFGHKAKDTLALSYPDWESMADEEQISVPHHRCEDTGMTDHRARLYIKYTDGAYVFMCHNCGVHGMYRPKERASMVREEMPQPYKTPHGKHGLIKIWNALSPVRDEDMPLWLLEHGIDGPNARGLGICVDGLGVYMPIYDGPVRGVQRRNFKGAHKYTTEVLPEFPGYARLYPMYKSDVLYITEDLLSHYKLYLSGKASLAVLGTKTPTNMPKGYDKVVIWLDNDAAGHKGTINMVRELSALYPNVTTFFEEEAKTWPLEKLKMLP